MKRYVVGLFLALSCFFFMQTAQAESFELAAPFGAMPSRAPVASMATPFGEPMTLSLSPQFFTEFGTLVQSQTSGWAAIALVILAYVVITGAILLAASIINFVLLFGERSPGLRIGWGIAGIAVGTVIGGLSALTFAAASEMLVIFLVASALPIIFGILNLVKGIQDKKRRFRDDYDDRYGDRRPSRRNNDPIIDRIPVQGSLAQAFPQAAMSTVFKTTF